MKTDDLLSRLQKVRQTGPMKWQSQCPAHNDKYPSLAIKELEDNRLLLHCFAGCGVNEIVTAIGLRLIDLFPDSIPLEGHKPDRRPFLPSDAQDTLAMELTVVVIGLIRMLDYGLDRADIERIILAAERLNDVLNQTTGYADRKLEEAKKAYLCRT